MKKLTSKEKGKISNSSKSSPGNSKKNSPLFNRDRRDCINVFNKDQEKILASLTIDGKPDVLARKKKLEEWGMSSIRMISDGAGVGRCGIAKDEASTPSEILRVKEKMEKGLLLIKEGESICPICNCKIDPNDKVEFSHTLSKSETVFRQHAENVDWVHEKCNRTYGDIKDLNDIDGLEKRLKSMLENMEKIRERAIISEKISGGFDFDEKNRPYEKEN
jgi:uncharacterized Zn finger protein (UPF0148 family)